MPTIKFVRVERDCPANKDRRADGDARGIIYDFDVMIDGEKRAEMHRSCYGKGYTVQDADGRAVDPPLPHYRTGREVGSKAEFLQIVVELLEAGKMPTLVEMELKRYAEARAKAGKIVATKEEQRKRAIGANAEIIYEALKALTAAPTNIGAIADAQTALAVVDGEAADWMAAVDADPGRFSIY